MTYSFFTYTTTSYRCNVFGNWASQPYAKTWAFKFRLKGIFHSQQSFFFLRRLQKWKNLPHRFDVYLVSVKSTVKILSIFVAFLENMNFSVKSSRNLPARWWTHNVAKTFSMRYFLSFFYFNANKNEINPFHDRERISGIFLYILCIVKLNR